jgi:hypothetical protein
MNATISDTLMPSMGILKLFNDTEGNVHRNNPFDAIVKLQKQGVAGKEMFWTIILAENIKAYTVLSSTICKTHPKNILEG